MTAAEAQLHLVVPGLLGPVNGLVPSVGRYPALESLLSKADRRPQPGADPPSVLLPLFGIEKAAGADWPSAALCSHGLGLGGGWWLHADPVMLRPDMERLLLFPSAALDIRAGEADSLIQLLNGHFRDDGWQLHAVSADRWLLHLAEAPAIATRPLHEVVGRSVFPLLPRGEDALRWHGLLNEAQMLMFDAPVNQTRREQGHGEINGIWPWGGGALPSCSGNNWHAVLSNDPLAVGLGRLAGARVLAADAEPPSRGDVLVYRDELSAPLLTGDPAAWLERFETLAPEFDRWLGGLRQRRWSRLLLYPCNGHSYCVSAAALRRFWRRSQPFAQFLSAGAR